MYTRCPHCTTIFRITAEQLRLTHGDLPCVTCAQSFNVLDSLADDVTTLIAAPDITDESENDTTLQDEILTEMDPVHEADEDQGSEEPDDDETVRDKIFSGVSPEEIATDSHEEDEYDPDHDLPDVKDPGHEEPEEENEHDLDPDQADTGSDHSANEDQDSDEPEEDITLQDKILADADSEEIVTDREQESEYDSSPDLTDHEDLGREEPEDYAMLLDEMPDEAGPDEIDADSEGEGEHDPGLAYSDLDPDTDEDQNHEEPEDNTTLQGETPGEDSPDEIDADSEEDGENVPGPELVDTNSDDDTDEDQDQDEQLFGTMEFDTPEQTWTRTLLTTDAIASLEPANLQSDLETESDRHSPTTEFPIADDSVYQPWITEADTVTESFEFQTADKDEWQRFLAELGDDNSITATENENQNQIMIDDPGLDDLEADDLEADDLEADDLEANDPEANDPEADDPEADDPEADDLEADDPEADDFELDDFEQFSASEPQDEEEATTILPWLEDETMDNVSAQPGIFRISWRVTGICVALVLLLAGQLIHYNRDALATDATYGNTIQAIYGLFNAMLYPDWPLNAFEITGTEAIAGHADQNALDVHANVIVRGQHPIGLPLIRIVLRDRWANPVASRVFTPGEYLHTHDAENKLVNPGTIFPVEISVADPGAEALGYVVDICLPRRKSGLECQIAQDPFQ